MADETTKTEKVKTAPAPKKASVTNDDILAAVKGTTDAVMALVETLKSKPVETGHATIQPNAQGGSQAGVRQFSATGGSAGGEYTRTPGPVVKSPFPVPIEWRDLVDSTLNKEFGVEVAPESDTASFGFSILVPEKYSNAGKPHWETYHEDRRTRVISHALGLNGVREWTTKVYENFDPETKSRITFDRAQL